MDKGYTTESSGLLDSFKILPLEVDFMNLFFVINGSSFRLNLITWRFGDLT